MDTYSTNETRTEHQKVTAFVASADKTESGTPEHGKDGWILAKYEWRDGRGRFLYVRGTEETQEVWRDQPKYLVGGAR